MRWGMATERLGQRWFKFRREGEVLGPAERAEAGSPSDGQTHRVGVPQPLRQLVNQETRSPGSRTHPKRWSTQGVDTVWLTFRRIAISGTPSLLRNIRRCCGPRMGVTQVTNEVPLWVAPLNDSCFLFVMQNPDGQRTSYPWEADVWKRSTISIGPPEALHHISPLRGVGVVTLSVVRFLMPTPFRRRWPLTVQRQWSMTGNP